LILEAVSLLKSCFTFSRPCIEKFEGTSSTLMFNLEILWLEKGLFWKKLCWFIKNVVLT